MRRQQTALAKPGCLQPLVRHAALHEVGDDGLRAPLRQPEVVLRRAGRVRMSLQRQPGGDELPVVERRGHTVEVPARALGQLRRVERELDAQHAAHFRRPARIPTTTEYAVFSVRIKGVADRERSSAARQAGEGGCRLRNQEPETSHELQVDGPTVLGTPGVGCPSDRDGGGLA